MKAYLEIPIEMAVERIEAEPSVGLGEEVRIISAMIDNQAFGAHAPTWVRKTPEKDGPYFYREKTTDKAQLVEISGNHAHFTLLGAVKSLRWLAHQKWNAQWARIPMPGESLPVSVDVAKLEDSDRKHLEELAERKSK